MGFEICEVCPPIRNINTWKPKKLRSYVLIKKALKHDLTYRLSQNIITSVKHAWQFDFPHFIFRFLLLYNIAKQYLHTVFWCSESWKFSSLLWYRWTYNMYRDYLLFRCFTPGNYSASFGADNFLFLSSGDPQTSIFMISCMYLCAKIFNTYDI